MRYFTTFVADEKASQIFPKPDSKENTDIPVTDIE